MAANTVEVEINVFYKAKFRFALSVLE